MVLYMHTYIRTYIQRQERVQSGREGLSAWLPYTCTHIPTNPSIAASMEHSIHWHTLLAYLSNVNTLHFTILYMHISNKNFWYLWPDAMCTSTSCSYYYTNCRSSIYLIDNEAGGSAVWSKYSLHLSGSFQLLRKELCTAIITKGKIQGEEREAKSRGKWGKRDRGEREEGGR